MKTVTFLVLIWATATPSFGQYATMNCGTCEPGLVRAPSNGPYCGPCVKPTTSCSQGYIQSGNGNQCVECPCGNQDPLKIRTQGCRRDPTGGIICDCNQNYAGPSCQNCAPGCLQRDAFPYDCYRPGETVSCFGPDCNGNIPQPPQIQPPVAPPPPPPPSCPGNTCGNPDPCQNSMSTRCRLPQTSLCPGCQCSGAGCPCDTCQFNQNHYSTAIQVAGSCPPCVHQHTACPPCNAQCPSCPATTTTCPGPSCGSPCQAASCECPPPCPTCCNQCGVISPSPEVTYLTYNSTYVLPTNIYNTTIIYQNITYINSTCSNIQPQPSINITIPTFPTFPSLEYETVRVCQVCCDPRGTYDFGRCHTGKCECSCKANVIGAQCDRCRPGHFGLLSSNRDGCVSCFCSGVSSECSEAVFYQDFIEISFPRHDLRVHDRTFDYVKGIEVTDKVVTLSYIDYKNVDVLYWILPEQFTGNRLTSYGGRIHVTRSFTTDDGSRSLLGNDIIIIGTYGSSIYWASPETHASGSSQKLRVPIDDKSGWLSFRHGTPSVATRNEIMEVLADVKKVLIRASMGPPPSMVTAKLSGVQLTTASSKKPSGVSTPGITSLVEDCVCPAGYQGWSCESCSPGYYRDNTDTSKGVFGTCKKCPCGPHSDGCSLKNGKVFCHCKQGYSGPDCTSCEPLSMTLDPIRCRGCYNEMVSFNCSYSGGSTSYDIVLTTVPSMTSYIAPAATRSAIEFPGTVIGNSRTIKIPLFFKLQAVNCEIQEKDTGNVVMSARASIHGENCDLVDPIPAPNVFLNVSTDFLCIFANETAEVSCSSNYPYGTISWTREERSKMPQSVKVYGSTIRFNNPKPSDSGAYVCVLEDYNLNTIYIRTVVLKVKSCKYLKGGVFVPAPGSNGTKPVDPVDYIDDEYSSDDADLPMEEPGIQADAPMDYEVTAASSTTPGSTSGAPIVKDQEPEVPTEVTQVLAPENIQVIPAVQTVTAGQKVEIKCVADGSDVKIMWRSESDNSDNALASDSGVLLFYAVKESDEGNYICIAYNTAGKATVKATLVVEPATFKLKIATTSKPDEFDLGSQIILTCSGSEEVYKYQWSKSRGDMPSTATQHANGSLVISSLKPADLGVYVCTAVSIGGHTAEAKVQVNSKEATQYTPPQVRLNQKSPYRVAPGQSFRIRCETKGDPMPVISWSRRMLSEQDGPFEQTIRETQLSKDSLDFLNVTEAEEGHYTCTGRNVAGEDHKTVLIIVDDQQSQGCSATEFRCRNGTQCIPKALRCNGERDCADGSDENHSACARWKKAQGLNSDV